MNCNNGNNNNHNNYNNISLSKHQTQPSAKDFKLSERLFWSIFRNKFLFNTIFSNFKFKYIKSYEDLIGVESIFNGFSNAVEIIIDKLNCGAYVFKNEKDILNIFSMVKKDTLDNRRLYNLLFDSIYKSNFTDNEIRKINELWFIDIKLKENIFALKQYINYLNKRNDNSYSSSHYFCGINSTYKSIKVIRCLKDGNCINPNIKIKDLNFGGFGTIDRQVFDDIKLKQLIKLYKNIIHIYYNNNSIKNQKSYKYHQLIELLNQFTINHFSIDQINSTIKDLIINSSEKTVQLLYNNNNTLNNNDNNNNSSSNSSICNNNKSNNNNIIESFQKYYNKIFKFKSKEYNSECNDNESNTNNSSNQSPNISNCDSSLSTWNNLSANGLKNSICPIKIKDLIKQYYRVMFSLDSSYKYFKPIEYYIYFSSKEKLFKKLNKEFQNVNFVTIIKNGMDIVEITLRGNRDDQIKFITDHIQYFNSAINTTFLTRSKNLDLVSIYLNCNGSLNSTPISILNNIQDPSQLDYYFKNHNQLFFSDNNKNWMYIKSLPILEYYESLMKSCSRKFRIGSITCYINFEILTKALSTPSLYNLKSTHINFKHIPIRSVFKYNSQESIIELLSSPKIVNFNLSKISSINFYKVYYWIFKDLSNDSLIECLKNNQDQQQYFIRINNNKNILVYNDSNNMPTQVMCTVNSLNLDSNSITYFINYWDLIKCLVNCGRIVDIIECFNQVPELLNDNNTFLDKIVSPIRNLSVCSLEELILYYLSNLNSNTTKLLHYSLCVAANKGYLSLFKRLFINHPHVLKVKIGLNEGLFNSELLEDVIIGALRGNNSYLLKILEDYTGLKNTTFKKRSTQNQPNQ